MADWKAEDHIDSREWQQFCLRGHAQTVRTTQFATGVLVEKLQSAADHSRSIYLYIPPYRRIYNQYNFIHLR